MVRTEVAQQGIWDKKIRQTSENPRLFYVN